MGLKSRSFKTILTHFMQQSFKVGEMIDMRGHLNWKVREYGRSHTMLALDHFSFRLSDMEELCEMSQHVSKEVVRLNGRDRKSVV